MNDLRCCERCGVALSEAEPWGGACPRCMLELGIEPGVESPDSTLAVSGPAASRGVADSPGVIGRYRILRRIGEGGMGVVYEAEQDHPRRTVALKIIRPGRATPELLHRFEQESQALGRLQHPGIAQIYEAGAADTGLGPQPYFAMEFIRGKTLKDYAAAHHLSTQQRLEMIVKVAEAVHHAHQRGLIHRDLKPANIIVDETGQPKILDFGVARATDSDAQATTHTNVGQLVGTLAYMSPEQVLADPLELDTRSDVYSLGVILYELLAGCLPYTISKKLPETIHAIREEDPAKLSAVSRTYRGDIETIVAKALEKDKSRRYGSAAELAADIGRYLKDEPIVARPTSTSYQLQKFARRHKALVGGIAAVFIVLVGGIVVSTTQAIRASRAEIIATEERDRALQEKQRTVVERERADQNAKDASRERDRAVKLEGEANTERDKAVAEKQRADTEAETARAVQEFLGNDLLRMANPSLQGQSFQSGQLASPSNPNITVKELLDRASGKIASKFDKKPLVESAIRETIAETYFGMGVYENAREHFEKALALRSREQGPDNLDTMKTTMRLAETLSALRKWQESLPLIKQVIESGRRGPGDDNPATQSAIRLLVNNYLNPRYVRDPKGMAWQQKPLVEELLKSTIAYDRQKLGDQNPATQLAISGLLVLYKNEQPQRIAALEAFLKPLYEDQRARRGASDPITRNTMNELMSLYMSQTPRRLAEAEGLLKSLVQDSRRRLGDDNPASIAAVTQLVSFYTAPPARYAQAEAFLRPIVDDQRRRLGDGDRATLSSLNLLVRVLMTQPQPRYAEVESFVKSIRDDQVRKLGSGGRAAMNSTNQLANLYLRQNRFTEAEDLLVPIVTDSAVNKLLEGGRSIFTEQGLLLDSMDLLSQVYSRQGKSQQADALAKKLGNVMAVALKSSLTSTAGTENLATPLMTILNLAAGYARQGRDADADELMSTVLEGYRSVARTDPNARDIARTLSSMATIAYGSRGQIAKAELLVKAVLDIQLSELGDGDPATMDTLRALATLYAGQRKFVDAQDTYRRLIALQGQALGPIHPATLSTMTGRWVLYATEYRFFKAQGQREQARQAARNSIPFITEFLDLRRSSPGADSAQDIGLLTISLTTANTIAGNHAEAEDIWSQSMGRRRAAGSLMPDAIAILGWLQFLQGKYSSAETLYRDTCPRIAIPVHRLNCQSMLGAALAAQKKFEEAEPVLLQSHEQMRSLAVGLPPAISTEDFIFEQEPGERILKLYEDWGKPEKVAEWEQKLQEQKAEVPPRRGGVPQR